MIIQDIFDQSLFSGSGRCSLFGGQFDTGVTPDEDLALAEESDIVDNDSPLNGLWLAEQPPGTTGLARRLNLFSFYCACRWDYQKTSRDTLRRSYVVVFNNRNKRVALVKPVDWGPNIRTGRVIDLSPGAAYYLGLSTDSLVMFALWIPALSSVPGAAQQSLTFD